MKQTIKIFKVREVRTPERGTPGSAGIDFFVPERFEPALLFPGMDILIPSGIVAKIPEGHMLIAANKSGVAVTGNAMKAAGLPVKPNALPSTLLVGAEVVDEDFQGEIFLHVVNVGPQSVEIVPGMKLEQLILVPVTYAAVDQAESMEELFDGQTERGSGCLGSTDR